MDFLKREFRDLSMSELDAHRSKVMEQNTWAVGEKASLRIEDFLAPRGHISAFFVNRQENQFFYDCKYLKDWGDL